MTNVLNKVFIRSFYRQNAGFFFFLFLVFFGIVAPSQQPAYHYALIRGILAAKGFLALVCVMWLIYALKVGRFVTQVLARPEYQFLYKLNELSRIQRYWLLLKVQGMLFLPVWIYSLAITGVAWYKRAFGIALVVQVYIVLTCLVAAARYHGRLEFPANSRSRQTRQSTRRRVPFWSILLRFLYTENKALLAGVKITSCLILCQFLKQQRPDEYDLRMPYLVYSLALFGHGVFIYRCRKMETTELVCYKCLPVPLMGRFLQYGLFYFLLLLPEILILAWLTPHSIHFMDSVEWVLSGYSVLLLLNSILLVAVVRAWEFLKIGLVIFGILYCCVLGGLLIEMSGFFYFTAAVLFFHGYFRVDSDSG
jgi:hypothetical protein